MSNSLPGPAPVSSERLDVLLLDYEMGREDERVALNATAAMAGVAAALLAGIFALLAGDCRLRDPATDCYRVPDSMLATAPVLPFAVMAFILAIGLASTIKSFYLRTIESELRVISNSPLKDLTRVTSPSAIELQLAVTSPVRGRRTYRLVLATLLTSCFVAFIGLVFAVAIEVGWPWRIAMLAGYSTMTFVLIKEAYAANLGGRSLFEQAVGNLPLDYPRVDVSRRVASQTLPQLRRLAAYLILPRPQDLIKWTFIPLTFAIGLCLPQSRAAVHTSSSIELSAVVFLSFEYLGYQARYQWNDIRGLSDDLDHPSQVQRKRLPVTTLGARASVIASATIATLRTSIALLIAVSLPSPYRSVLLVGLATTWLVAVVYEACRTSGGGARALHARARLTWVIVGGGYAVRTLVGLSLAMHSAVPTWSTTLLALAAWSYGIVFVTLTWILEAVGHCYRNARSGALFYAVGPVRPDIKSLDRKRHLIDLISFSGLTATPSTDVADFDVRCDDVRPLATGRTPLAAPWNICLVLACTVSAFACTLQPAVLPRVAGIALIAGVPLLGSALLTTARSLRWRLLLLAVLLSASGVSTYLVEPSITPGLVAVVAIFCLTYISFRNNSYSDLRDFGLNTATKAKSLVHGAGRLGVSVVRLVIGARTYDRIK